MTASEIVKKIRADMLLRKAKSEEILTKHVIYDSGVIKID